MKLLQNFFFLIFRLPLLLLQVIDPVAVHQTHMSMFWECGTYQGHRPRIHTAKSHICLMWPVAICRMATERRDRACGGKIQTHWETWDCSSTIISLDLLRVQRLKATGPAEMWSLHDIFISNMVVLSRSGMAEKLHLPPARRGGT